MINEENIISDVSSRDFDVSYSRFIHELKTENEDCSAHIILAINRQLQPASNGILSSCVVPKLLQVAVDMSLIFNDNCTRLETYLRNFESSITHRCILSRLDENIAILSCVDELVKRLVAPDCSLHLETTVDVLEKVIFVLLTAFRHCKNNEDAYGRVSPEIYERIVGLFRKCNDLQVRCFEYLNSHNIECQSQDDTRPLVRVLNAIIEVGKVVTDMDLKTMAQLWKGFISLVKIHATVLLSSFNVGHVLQFFCEEIQLKINLAYSFDIKQLPIMLKIVCFLLKIVVKLCEYFAQHLTDCYSHLYGLILKLYGNSRYFVELDRVEIAMEIENVLLAAVDPLIGSLIGDKNFAQFVCIKRHISNCTKVPSNFSEKDAPVLLFFCYLLQKLSLTSVENRELWLEHLILDSLFDNISQNIAQLYYEVEVAFCSTNDRLPQQISLYDALIVHLSSFVICSLSYDRFAHFEELLLTHLLTSPLAVKLFVSDVWCVVVRYGNAELRCKHVEYLIEILALIEEEKTVVTLVVSLMKRIFRYLSKQQQKKILDLVSQNGPLLVELYLQYDPGSEISDIVPCLNETKLNALANDSIESIYAADKLLSQVPDHLEIQIEKSWRELCAGKILHPRRFMKYVRYLCALKLRNNDTEIILMPYFKNLVCFESLYVKLNMLKYVKTLARITVPTKDEEQFCRSISLLFGILLRDKNPIIQIHALEVFSCFSHTTKYEKVIQYTVANNSSVKSIVANYLQNKITSKSTQGIRFDYFLKDLFGWRFSSYVINSIAKKERCLNDEEKNCKKMKLEYDCISEADKIESNVVLLLQNICHCELKLEEKNSLRKLLNTVEKIRSYL